MQDTSDVPLSPAMQSCCAAGIQNFQADFTSFAQQVPAFGGQFRNLNLLLTGMNMVSDLMSRARSIREDFVALKRAPNTQAASAALSAKDHIPDPIMRLAMTVLRPPRK